MTYLASILVVALAFAQEAPDPSVQSLFEAGKYQELIEKVSTTEAPSPEDVYLAALASRKLDPPDNDAAREWFGRLEMGEENTWTRVGRSSTAIVDGDATRALDEARRAVELAPEDFYPQFQLGLAYAESKDYANAATTLEKSTTLNPSFAYAHYYAGMSYYQIKRVDKMANFFERFIKLAPNAPERPAIQSLMRSIRR